MSKFMRRNMDATACQVNARSEFWVAFAIPESRIGALNHGVGQASGLSVSEQAGCLSYSLLCSPPSQPRMACAADCPGGGSRQPVSGKRAAGAVGVVEDTPDQPQVSLRRHQAHWKMAHVARGAFTGAHRPELRRDL